MMKLIRMTSDFPNVSFLVAFDRTRVAASLADDGDIAVGEQYIEKITQVVYELPKTPEKTSSAEFFQSLDQLVANVAVGPLNHEKFSGATVFLRNIVQVIMPSR